MLQIVFFWCLYLVVINHDTGMGKVLRKDFPTELQCNKEANRIQKEFNMETAPICKRKKIEGQDT